MHSCSKPTKNRCTLLCFRRWRLEARSASGRHLCNLTVYDTGKHKPHLGAKLCEWSIIKLKGKKPESFIDAHTDFSCGWRAITQVCSYMISKWSHSGSICSIEKFVQHWPLFEKATSICLDMSGVTCKSLRDKKRTLHTTDKIWQVVITT